MNQVIPYQNYLKPANVLPKYINFEKYKQLREEVTKYYDNLKMPNKRNAFLKDRDSILIDFLWATGGRIGDIVRVKNTDIDFDKKILILNVKKTKITIDINLDPEMLYMLSNYMRKYMIQDYLFKTSPNHKYPITTTAAWYVMNKFGSLIGIKKLHPHMFRHGLAFHMLNSGVNINYITYRLGHKNPQVTIGTYLKVTPELEKRMIDDAKIEWR